MHKFMLLDYSLDRVGGHNYEYDRLCLDAAQSLGLEPLLAAQRTFRDPFRESAPWAVHPVYPRGKYSAHRLGQRLARLDANGTQSGPARLLRQSWSALKQWYYLRENRRFNHRLAQATSELLDRLALRPGDQVYLPTISISDLPGLTEFFQRHRAARQLDWHLQFHLPLAAGDRSADPRTTPMWTLAQRWLADCVRVMPERLHLYATTESLAAQYSDLGAALFQPLPWLVDPAFHEPMPSLDRLPLRLLYSGGMRKEKGFGELPKILDSLWDEYFATGRLQLVLQAPSRETLPATWQPHALWQADPSERTRAPIAVSPFPMDSDKYRRFVRSADVGLLLYEPEAYSIRCSGICLEMLCAGVPIVVREGTWLASQVRQGKEVVREDVGLIVPSLDTLADQIRRIAASYGDFRQAAMRFSSTLAARHHPRAVLAALLRRSEARPATAAA